MVGSSQTDPPSVTDPRTWESTHCILSPIRPHGLVRGFVTGVVDTNDFVSQLNSIEIKICLPPGVTINRVGDIACKYLADHPEERHHTASGVVLKAIFQAFPCQPPTVEQGSPTEQNTDRPSQ